MINVQPPSGTRDFLAGDLRKRRQVIRVIQEVYESFGFEPLETPAFENLSTLLGKYGDEGDQLLFRILRRGEKLQETLAAQNLAQNDLSDMALRYDLTVPLARVMARYRSQLPKFYKRYQIQPVWRADRPAKGRFREFMQCDVDVCGSKSPVVEAEIIAAACVVLKRLGIDDFKIQINHREALRGMISAAKIPPELEASSLVAIDKLDKIGKESVTDELIQRGISQSSAWWLFTLFDEMADASDNYTRITRWWNRVTPHVDNTKVRHTRDNLEQILEYCKSSSAHTHLVFNPSLARGLSYYTGAIFEVIVPGVSGSLGGGGRYDGLIGMFAGQEIPACGFSLGLERVLLLMEEQGKFQDAASAIQIMFTNFAEMQADILALANRLRSAGVACDIYPEPAGLKQQFNYAAARQVRYVAFFGEREKEAGQLRLKRQSDGMELNLALAEVEKELLKLI